MKTSIFKFQYLRTTDPIPFAQIYHAAKRSNCYEHRYLNVMSQSVKVNEKLLMMQYIAVQCHQYTLYVAKVVADLAII